MQKTAGRSSRRSSAADTRILIGIIADEETTIGFLLAGIGETTPDNKRNFLMATESTPIKNIEDFFDELYHRKNIGVIFIGADIKPRISGILGRLTKTIPIILEIPTRASIVRSLEMKETHKKVRAPKNN